MRAVARRVLERSPMLDGLFRRIVWSRVHYPERELRLLEAMPGRQLDVAVDVGAALVTPGPRGALVIKSLPYGFACMTSPLKGAQAQGPRGAHKHM